MKDIEVLNRLQNALGGLTKISEALGTKSPQAVLNWRRRGIPSGWRFAVRKLANQRAACRLPMSWLDPRAVAKDIGDAK